ncbi:hypothetical protein PHMEG_00012110 [Phytophthora megakarya]|uniref:Uncharacterized protein n=1 Tax=Phytophthora megakarya TaxID=4795 RepID=A0A225WB12_9STRA|nr:hypothetical protein PHMEG_00012110 [Phytophthora megakarya]
MIQRYEQLAQMMDGIYALRYSLRICEECPRNIDELIKCIIASYQKPQHDTLEDTFVSLEKVMECIIQDLGNNSYKRPHMCKKKLRRAGLLLKNYKCNATAYLEGAAYHLWALGT